MAPAAVVALLLVVLSRLCFGLFKQKKPINQAWWVQVAIIFIANLIVLTTGLLFFGRDGKMLTYSVLIVVAAFCQWLLMRGWKT